MDEQSWMNEDRSSALFFHMQGLLSDRKFRLMAVAFIRTFWMSRIGPEEQQVLEAIEREADEFQGKMSQELSRQLEGYQLHGRSNRVRLLIGLAGLSNAWSGADDVADRTSGAGPIEKWEERDQVVCGLVRDIAGNPFRPAVFAPEWRTSTAVLLATQMYESRDFSAAPILADALQDAGCTDEEALRHLRGHGPHCRGCWVVDLVLGKE